MLDAPDVPHGVLLVMDRGIATVERTCRLRGQGRRYLVVSRERTRHYGVALDTDPTGQHATAVRIGDSIGRDLEAVETTTV